ncbi:MAG: hypothetical protein CVV11_13170 [Gammaproteobacteria bacterium HGW-Gammaproteobacteria-15]|nr:MAG: hypothetical protein CVV11_13170 [Gammaproteobacteria bacterium HGW-Gammaproteobacteria-15]
MLFYKLNSCFLGREQWSCCQKDVQSGATYQYGTKPGQCGRNRGPRAVSQIGTTSYCYDVSGQQTHQYNNGTLVRQIDYDAIGKPSRIRSMGTDATTNSSPGDSFFTYDGSRNVIKRHVTEQSFRVLLTPLTYIHVGRAAPKPFISKVVSS